MWNTLTKIEVKQLLQENGLEWDEFDSWMLGHTYMGDNDGNALYYEDDVLTFVQNKTTIKFVGDKINKR